MIKKLLAICLSLFAAMAFAAVDVNKATQADLDSVKGIGPAIAGKIMEERKKAPFKDWTDFVDRVKGVGEGNAAKFSAEGLTVNGATFNGVAAKPAAAAKKDEKKDEKPAAKAEAKKEAAEKAKAEKAEKAAAKKADADKAKAAAPAASAAKK